MFSTKASLLHATYYAPRGQKRLKELARRISQRYLSLDDRLIGVVGGPGAGKSVFIEGLFPRLMLTNDDEGINVRPLPLIEDYKTGNFKRHTYHVDAQFEAAFVPNRELAEAIRLALFHKRRVVVEHFDKIYPRLKVNAQFLVGIGEEIIITHPSILGPDPSVLSNLVEESLVYRKMAHSAEDLTFLALKEFDMPEPIIHSEVKHGFALEFKNDPKIDIEKLENRVKEFIYNDLYLRIEEGKYIVIGENKKLFCTCPRVHVKRTGEIEDFKLLPEIRYDNIMDRYFVVGTVGKKEMDFFKVF